MRETYTLSESYLRQLQEMLAWWRRQKEPIRPRSTGDDELAPETYIALTPAAGIAALTEGPDTGTGYGAGDTPGTAPGVIPGAGECDIYRIDDDGSGRAEMAQTEAATGIVYNLSESAVPGSSWVLITRDKWGSWIVVQPPATTTTTSTTTTTTTATTAAPGAGSCELASLTNDDYLSATDGEQTVRLAFSAGDGHWHSLDISTGTGTATDEEYEYPLGAGPLEFWFESGSLHLSLDGLELLDCGDGCFSGGPLTGHDITYGLTGTGTEDYAACAGDIFTVCVACEAVTTTTTTTTTTSTTPPVC